MEKKDETGPLAVYESVRCLECGASYAKPRRGGTTTVNPGCPECGYVGWVSAKVPFRGVPQRRSAGGHRLGRSAPSR